MKWVMIEDISNSCGETVELRGWLANRRSSGKIRFLQVRDGTGVIQCVVTPSGVSPDVFKISDSISYESSLTVWGQVKKDPRSSIGFELEVNGLEIVSAAEQYPISKKDHGIGFLMDNRHLWLRSSRQNALMRLRSLVVKSARNFFDERNFVSVEAPILTPTACEGTTSLFEVGYFDRSAYLSQSGQLYGEAAAMALGKIYVYGPTFRAEKSKTRRHLTEFWMIEPEMAYWELPQAMDLAESLVCRIVEETLLQGRSLLETLERDLKPLESVTVPFPRITYSEAVEMVRKKGLVIEWGQDLGADEEASLSACFDRPVFVTHYPSDCKAFYMKRDAQDSSVCLAMDLLAPEGYGEIVGGGQREDSLQTLVGRIEEHGLDKSSLEWYLDLRRFGSAPHSGFGLGIERTLAWIAGIHHVRETIAFPRLMDRLNP
jgi:asparaginyl-tRNA synthetase